MGNDSVSRTDFGSPGKSVKEIEDIFDEATNQAKQEIEKEQKEHRVRNVFISFHHEDENQVDFLRMQAKRDEYNLEFRDHSVKERIDEKWRQEVREKISGTSATIVMIGEHTVERPNVLFEINESYSQGKKVIGVRIYGDKNHTIPEPMIKNNASIVQWKLSEIQTELDKP